ncbi:ATPase, AAA-type, core, partial [Dillenia turbinata]
MEFDMDIPLPDELEWLESNSHLQDYYEDEEQQPQFYPPEEDEEEEEEEKRHQNQNPKPSLQIPPKPNQPSISVPEHQINAKKRFRLDGSEALNPEDDAHEKRTRSDSAELEIDEDWLPPPRETIEVEPEPVEFVTKEKSISRYASEIDGDWIPVTGLNGDRVYAKLCRFEDYSLEKFDRRAQSLGLLSQPINLLMQKVEQEAFAKALQESSENQNDIIITETSTVKEELWVDKYAPNSFTELLSDEQTNREVLSWLKQWDSSVFGAEIRETADEVLSALRRYSSFVQHKRPSSIGFSRKHGRPSISKEGPLHSNGLDQDNRSQDGILEFQNKKSRLTGPPEKKVLLLCGPPGLGKTTLAHVAAKHCGYHVVEINASDDRSSSTIEAKILDVVQMNSVMANSKPKCLVIDEIDGSLGDGKGAVDVIVKMMANVRKNNDLVLQVTAERKSDLGKENVTKEGKPGRSSSKKGHKTALLSRPVICICNDLYARTLRQLRQVANKNGRVKGSMYLFNPLRVVLLAGKLKYICGREGVNTCSIALTALADYTECDIRSCLNTLQFLSKKKETLNMLDIGSQVVGRKDISKGVFDIWRELTLASIPAPSPIGGHSLQIFQKKKMKVERQSERCYSSMSNKFDFLHSLISNRGDFEVILDGIHENMLQLCYHDPVMRKTVKCFNELGVSDIVHQYVMRTHQMSIYVYQPAIAIAVHNMVAQVEKPIIEWPKSFLRYQTNLMAKMDILKSWISNISPCISRHLSTKSFVEETVSHLLHLLSPPTLRPVALHLLSEKERHEMDQLVSTMVSYSITYKNTKPETSHSVLRHEETLDASALVFEPPIADFIGYKDYRPGHFLLASAMKKVLVHEVEKQKILQKGAAKCVHPSDELNKEKKSSPGERNQRADSAKSNCVGASNMGSNSNSRQHTDTSYIVASSMGNLNSATAGLKQQSNENAKKPLKSSSSFFERFIKGFTNAVKRP